MTHILTVEDQPMVRKLLESYVEKEPDFVLAASIPGANLAPELCRQRQIDLILMDVQAETGKAAFPLRRGSSGNTRKSKSSL